MSGCLTLSVLLATAAPVAACLPVGPSEDWSFDEGLALAFGGTVIAVRDDPALVVSRIEVVIGVEWVLAGDVPAQVSLVRGDPYCDSLRYKIGDQMVVASGFPGPGGNVFGLDSEEFEPGPPYNKYQVAVWAFGPDGTPTGDIGPRLGGKDVAASLDDLIAALRTIPNTALPPEDAPLPALGVLLVVLAGVVASRSVAAGRRISR